MIIFDFIETRKENDKILEIENLTTKRSELISKLRKRLQKWGAGVIQGVNSKDFVPLN